MRGEGSVFDLLRARKGEIVSAWAACAFRSYPAQTARFLAEEPDPFRNPVGHLFRHHLAALFDELVGEMDPQRVVVALDAIARVRAVQDGTQPDALEFLGRVKGIIGRSLGGCEQAGVFGQQIETISSLASERLAHCRERMTEVQAHERARRMWVAERMRAKAQNSGVGRHSADAAG